jgi:hypothetical protein
MPLELRNPLFQPVATIIRRYLKEREIADFDG